MGVEGLLRGRAGDAVAANPDVDGHERVRTGPLGAQGLREGREQSRRTARLRAMSPNAKPSAAIYGRMITLRRIAPEGRRLIADIADIADQFDRARSD